jgi:rare lipoprotein A
LAALPNPMVREETRSKWGNGPVYTVLGKSYRVMADADGFNQEGLASWYGTKFHGKRTSSGEPFDMYGLSAAHRHLPLPSYVKVTNLQNGRSTIVKVNDRGPFHSDRVIDLSYAAAVKLGFHDEGTARVRIEVQSPVRQPPAYLLQAGAFRQLENADRLQHQLQQLTGLPGIVVKTSDDGFYRVRLGPVRAGQELERVQALMLSAKYSKPRLIPSSLTD